MLRHSDMRGPAQDAVRELTPEPRVCGQAVYELVREHMRELMREPVSEEVRGSGHSEVREQMFGHRDMHELAQDETREHMQKHEIRELIREQMPEETYASQRDDVCGSRQVASRERRATSRERRATSRERRATSRERRGGSCEHGMVTAELALGLIPISLLVILLLATASFVSAFLQAQGVSYAAARNAAVGKPFDTSSLGVRGAHRTSIEVGSEGEYVVVTASVEPVGVLGWLDVTASSTLSLPLEPGVTLP
ncbi:MAG: hypothetical protein QM705_10970 [Ancrocorticia sp.]